MQTIGQLVQEALDLAGRNLFEPAFVAVCGALDQTAQKIYADDVAAPEPPYQRFINQNWQLIAFMGLAPKEILPPDLPFRLRRVISSFNSRTKMEELLSFVVRQTLITRRLPPEVGFVQGIRFEVEGDRLLLPQSLLFALSGSIVLHPANKNESIPDNYWMHIRDFKMFISELWGRADLAERVMRLYA